jgi:hypothetical protein
MMIETMMMIFIIITEERGNVVARPDEVNEFFNLPDPSSCSIRSRKMFLGSVVLPLHKADNITAQKKNE